MNRIIILLLCSYFISFMFFFIIGPTIGLFAKNFFLMIVLCISFYSIISNKIFIKEMIYFILIFICFIYSFIFFQSEVIILFQSTFLLLYPILFVKLGFKEGSIKNINRFENLIIKFSVLNALFIFFEINLTDVFIVLGLPEFFTIVKGVNVGINPNTELPFNWHTNFSGETRRAAGILLAPLASGMLQAFVSYLLLTKLLEKTTIKDVILFLVVFNSLILTDSRGPIIFFIISILFFYFSNKNNITVKPFTKLIMIYIIIFLIYKIYQPLTLLFSIEDERAPGHLYSLINNIKGIWNIPLIGYGITSQGALIAESGYFEDLKGYGEGAFFSIIYQCGLVTGLWFLIWYFSLLDNKFKPYRYINGLIISAIPIMLTSDHFFTISGFSFIWYYLGLNLNENSSSLQKI